MGTALSMLGQGHKGRRLFEAHQPSLMTRKNVVIALCVVGVLFYTATSFTGVGEGRGGTVPPLPKNPRIVVIGSGVTGLGAAYRLHELEHDDWDVYETSELAGGLARSETDENGFTWDHGVHVLFSHFGYFDSLLDSVMPKDEWSYHTRSSPIYMRDRFVGYPLQNNVWKLPPADAEKCMKGLLEVHDDATRGVIQPKPKNFLEWAEQSFGPGIVDVFVKPYNFRVWAHPAKELNAIWVGERVAKTDFKAILTNMIYENEETHWGPNARFRYPSHGSGVVWDMVFRALPRERINFGKVVTSINSEAKVLTFSDGTKTSYDALISTMPMDKTLQMIDGRSDLAAWGKDPDSFKRQTVNLVGVGVNGAISPKWNSSHWIYFPEEVYPFYRITILSNFSPYMVALPGKQYSVLVEVSESKYRKVNQATLIDDVIEGLMHATVLPRDANIVSRWQARKEYGYPVPYVERDTHVHRANDELLKLAIWSRGRFGNWKYEVANQDHSCMPGVQAVDNVLFGEYEETLYEPNVVNGKKGKRTILPPKHKDKWDVVIPGCVTDAESWLPDMLKSLEAGSILPRVWVYSTCKSPPSLDDIPSRFEVNVQSVPASSSNVEIYHSHNYANYDILHPATFFLPGAPSSGASLSHPSPDDPDLLSQWETRGHYVYSTRRGAADNDVCEWFEQLYAYDDLECPSSLKMASVFLLSRGTIYPMRQDEYEQ